MGYMAGFLRRQISVVLIVCICTWSFVPCNGGKVSICQPCKSSLECGKAGFCCPNQKLCIPNAHSNCLCPNEDSAASKHSNNDRVHDSHKCGSKACYFCPGTKHPPTPAGKSSGQQNLRLSKSEQKRQKKAAGAKKKKEAAEKKKAAAAKKKKEGAAKKKAAADKKKQNKAAAAKQKKGAAEKKRAAKKRAAEAKKKKKQEKKSKKKGKKKKKKGGK